MSRTLKFRAWVNEHWVDWLPNSKTLGEYNEVGIYADEYETESKCYIEQYTGLKDKNGKEIYEGDIIKEIVDVDEPLVYEYKVVWDEDLLCWGLVGTGNHNYNLHADLYEVNRTTEVIGNVHEGTNKDGE